MYATSMQCTLHVIRHAPALQVSTSCCLHLYLTEVVESLVEVGQHASRGLVGDLDGVFQDALRDDVPFGG